MSNNLKCAECKDYLFDEPMQCSCGDRLCRRCYQSKISRVGTVEFECSLCAAGILVADCFRDRAVSLELEASNIQCTSQHCPWQGRSVEYKPLVQLVHVWSNCVLRVCFEPSVEEMEIVQNFEGVTEQELQEIGNDHLRACNFAMVSCPHSTCGCKQQVPRNEVSMHAEICQYRPVKCKWCHEYIAEESMERHKSTLCARQSRACDFNNVGCQFMGFMEDLQVHCKEQQEHHLHLMKQTTIENEQILEDKIKTLTQQNLDVKSQLALLMVKLANSVLMNQRLQTGFVGMALRMEALRATSYNGVYMWNILEIQKLKQQARIGETIALCSAPFYTSRYGYRVYLKLIIKGSGLEFGLMVMKGEYDAILPWPIRQKVLLMLLDQDRASNNMVMPLTLGLNSQRPLSDSSVAFGCPLLAPFHILGNPSYVKDDTMFVKCIIGNWNLGFDQ